MMIATVDVWLKVDTTVTIELNAIDFPDENHVK